MEETFNINPTGNILIFPVFLLSRHLTHFLHYNKHISICFKTNHSLFPGASCVFLFMIYFLFFSFFFFFVFLFLFFFKFYFIFKLYITVLVLPNIKMNPPQVYMCSPSRTLLPPPSPYQGYWNVLFLCFFDWLWNQGYIVLMNWVWGVFFYFERVKCY